MKFNAGKLKLVSI